MAQWGEGGSRVLAGSRGECARSVALERRRLKMQLAEGGEDSDGEEEGVDEDLDEIGSVAEHGSAHVVENVD